VAASDDAPLFRGELEAFNPTLLFRHDLLTETEKKAMHKKFAFGFQTPLDSSQKVSADIRQDWRRLKSADNIRTCLFDNQNLVGVS